MKAAKIVVVILLVGGLICWARHGHEVGHIARSLPFCGGHKPGLYDLGGLALLGLALWGLSRLRNATKSGDMDDRSTLTKTEDAHQVDEAMGEAPGNEVEDPASQSGGQNSP